jgi:TonB family protein
MNRGLMSASVLLYFLAVSNVQGAAQAGQTETPRKVANKVIPTYPPLARTMNLTGTVRLEVLVLANGTVKSVQVKGGNPLLAQTAQDAVRTWKWEKSEHDTTEAVEFKFAP